MAGALAVRCQARIFRGRSIDREVCGKNPKHGTRRWRSWALMRLGPGVGCSVLRRTRSPDADAEPAYGRGLRTPSRNRMRSQTLDFGPGLRERIEIGQKFSGLPIAPARSFPQGATETEPGEDRALSKRPRRPTGIR
jgi:hypothetical protein